MQRICNPGFPQCESDIGTDIPRISSDITVISI